MTGTDFPDKYGWMTVVETGFDGCGYPAKDKNQVATHGADEDESWESTRSRDSNPGDGLDGSDEAVTQKSVSFPNPIRSCLTIAEQRI